MHQHQPDDIPAANRAHRRHKQQQAKQCRRQGPEGQKGHPPSPLPLPAVAQAGDQRIGDRIEQPPAGGDQGEGVQHRQKDRLGDEAGNPGVAGRDVKIDQLQVDDVDQGRPAQLPGGVGQLFAQGEFGKWVHGNGKCLMVDAQCSMMLVRFAHDICSLRSRCLFASLTMLAHFVRDVSSLCSRC